MDIYANTSIGVKNPLGRIVKANFRSFFRFTKRKETIDFLILIANGFQSTNNGQLRWPNGSTTRVDTFITSLNVKATTRIGVYSKKFSFFEQGKTIPFRIVTSNYAEDFDFLKNNSSICDKKGQILIELDLRKPVKKWGQTPSGYIGIDYEWFRSNFRANNMFEFVWYDRR